MSQTPSRFSTVTRRAFLAGIPLAALVPVAACSTGGTTTTSSTTTSTTSGSSATSATTSTTSSSNAASLPTGANLEVAWTVTVTASGGGGGGGGGGMTKNPYMAVWVQDAAGAFVATLALYHKQNGDRWLDSLLTWYAASGGAEEKSTATVAAGSFTVTWDGTANGSKVAQGDYTICIETAVEHGNESLVQKSVTLGTKAVSVDLGTDNDLSTASVRYSV